MIPRNRKLWDNRLPFLEEMVNGIRFFRTKPNWATDLGKLRPFIMRQMEERGKDYPIKCMVGVAREVLQARRNLYDGVSVLIQHIPVWACKFCPEVFVGEDGHLIKTCHGYRRYKKNSVHSWIKGGVNDVIVPVETFHLQRMFQQVIKHNERFDHDRIPAVVELCLQAGVDYDYQMIYPTVATPDGLGDNSSGPETLSYNDLRLLAAQTLRAWETLRSGVEKLLVAYQARVCRHCSEVHVGPSGHDARMCGIFKYETWHGKHSWKTAKVDNLVPPKLVWYRRRQDPPILVDKWREYYGHAPAVVDICSKAGALLPRKYFPMMKVDGLPPPVE